MYEEEGLRLRRRPCFLRGRYGSGAGVDFGHHLGERGGCRRGGRQWVGRGGWGGVGEGEGRGPGRADVADPAVTHGEPHRDTRVVVGVVGALVIDMARDIFAGGRRGGARERGCGRGGGRGRGRHERRAETRRENPVLPFPARL